MALALFTFQAASNVTALGVPKAFLLPSGTSPTTLIVTNTGNEAVQIALTTAAATTTATQATVGATTIVVASASGIAVGQIVLGVGIFDGTAIPAGYLTYPNSGQTTTVTAINGTTITLSNPITAALSSTTVNFVAPIVIGTGLVILPGWPSPPLAIGSNTYLQAICSSFQSSAPLNVAVGT